jgi:6-phosphogluconate dehydrogenase (decarboxylating)
MNKADLKKLIKPLVKECIHEVLIEDGLLKNVVSEVASGLQGDVIVEARKPAYDNSKQQEARKKLNEHRAKLINSVNSDAYNGVNLFEGTEPMSAYEAQKPKAGSVDLGNPRDSGVDISSLMGSASKIWEAMK